MSWPLVKLGDVAPSKPIKKPAVKNPNEVWQLNLDMVESQTGKVISKVIAPVSDAGTSTHWFDERYVLYSKLRPYLNKVVLPDTQGLATTELVPMLPDAERLDRSYLVHYLRSNRFVSWINEQVAGAKMPRVSMKIFWEHEISLPPLDEQKRIAAILDKADAIRRKRQQAINLADDFLRSVFLDMFGDPVTNPKGWEVKKLVQLCGVGSSKRVFVDDFVDSGIPFYRGTEVGKLGEGKSIEPSLFISPQHYSELKEHGGVPKVGDLLLPSICPDGRIWRVEHEHPFYFKDGRVLWIKSGDSDVNSDYLRSLLQRIFFANYSQIASGTTFAELKIVALKNLDILVPPMDKQIEFSNVMRKTMANIETLNLAKKQAEEMFNSSSQKAFAGEL
ncbi:restriction endonuclease subunit S [Shewanella sp. 10N.286.51.B2]|uniref:restriction endonuclease subunit S n=1 Tax=Shewanella sp. 10N.286.51.B2 TaxID=3229707 RepID=UPI00354D8C26